jgi:hypothetical protein
MWLARCLVFGLFVFGLFLAIFVVLRYAAHEAVDTAGAWIAIPICATMLFAAWRYGHPPTD